MLATPPASVQLVEPELTISVQFRPPALVVQVGGVPPAALLSLKTIDGNAAVATMAGAPTRLKLFNSPVKLSLLQLGAIVEPLSTCVRTTTVVPALNTA